MSQALERYEQRTSAMVEEKVDINGGTGSEPRIVQRSASFTPVEQERMNLERHT